MATAALQPCQHLLQRPGNTEHSEAVAAAAVPPDPVNAPPELDGPISDLTLTVTRSTCAIAKSYYKLNSAASKHYKKIPRMM